MHFRLTGAMIAVLFLLTPAHAQDERFPGWHNRMTGYVAAKEPRWAVASWYGPGFHGRKTASGSRFNANGLSFAHKSMKFGTRVRFHHAGRSAVCICLDRGPFVRGREFDLSAGCARAIGMHGVARIGVGRV